MRFFLPSFDSNFPTIRILSHRSFSLSMLPEKLRSINFGDLISYFALISCLHRTDARSSFTYSTHYILPNILSALALVDQQFTINIFHPCKLCIWYEPNPLDWHLSHRIPVRAHIERHKELIIQKGEENEHRYTTNRIHYYFYEIWTSFFFHGKRDIVVFSIHFFGDSINPSTGIKMQPSIFKAKFKARDTEVTKEKFDLPILDKIRIIRLFICEQGDPKIV